MRYTMKQCAIVENGYVWLKKSFFMYDNHTIRTSAIPVDEFDITLVHKDVKNSGGYYDKGTN